MLGTQALTKGRWLKPPPERSVSVRCQRNKQRIEDTPVLNVQAVNVLKLNHARALDRSHFASDHPLKKRGV